MDIRFNALNSYSVSGKMNVSGAKKNSLNKNDKKISDVKLDSISISNNAVKNSEIFKLNSTIRAEIDGASNSDKISALREAVKNGSYNVSSDDIAGAILDRFV